MRELGSNQLGKLSLLWKEPSQRCVAWVPGKKQGLFFWHCWIQLACGHEHLGLYRYILATLCVLIHLHSNPLNSMWVSFVCIFPVNGSRPNAFKCPIHFGTEVVIQWQGNLDLHKDNCALSFTTLLPASGNFYSKLSVLNLTPYTKKVIDSSCHY